MKIKEWALGELVEIEILCPECNHSELNDLGSDHDSIAYWTDYECQKCGHKFRDKPMGSEI